jgi:hypothetical protein
MIPRRNQIEVLLSAWQELETRPVYVVAAERYHLHGISKPGLFDWIDQSRHYIGPLDAMKDKRTREVNMLKPVRGGGSVCGDAFLQYVLENDPGDYMQVLQTDDEVSQYASKRTIPNLEKSLRWMLPKFYPRGEGEIKLLNGYSLYISGPSISNMQTKMIRYMHLDEPHMYKRGPSAKRRGDWVTTFGCTFQSFFVSHKRDRHPASSSMITIGTTITTRARSTNGRSCVPRAKGISSRSLQASARTDRIGALPGANIKPMACGMFGAASIRFITFARIQTVPPCSQTGRRLKRLEPHRALYACRQTIRSKALLPLGSRHHGQLARPGRELVERLQCGEPWQLPSQDPVLSKVSRDLHG